MNIIFSWNPEPINPPFLRGPETYYSSYSLRIALLKVTLNFNFNSSNKQCLFQNQWEMKMKTFSRKVRMEKKKTDNIMKSAIIYTPSFNYNFQMRCRLREIHRRRFELLSRIFYLYTNKILLRMKSLIIVLKIIYKMWKLINWQP